MIESRAVASARLAASSVVDDEQEDDTNLDSMVWIESLPRGEEGLAFSARPNRANGGVVC
jgi:hypothetical protein